MTVRETVVNNKVGLFARPATFFIQKANEIGRASCRERV